MSDVQAVVWKEWREILRMSGSKRSAVMRHIFSVGIIGIIWPWQFGTPFVHNGLAVVLAAVTAMLYVAGASPDAIAGERERHTLETLLASRLPDRAILLGKIIAMIQFGCATALVMLIIGLITVNVVHGEGELLMLTPTQLVTAAVFTPLVAGLTASIGIQVSLRAKTVKQAQSALSTAIIIVLFLPAIALPAVPDSFRARVTMMMQGEDRAYVLGGFAVAILLVQAILFWIAMMRFRRDRLIV
jgi:ABC-2 type transport system permease protein